MPSNHLILCHLLLLLPSIFPRIRVFSNESALHISWPKYWNFSFNINPSYEYSGLISFKIELFDLLAVHTHHAMVDTHALPTPTFSHPTPSRMSLSYSHGHLPPHLLPDTLISHLPWLCLHTYTTHYKHTFAIHSHYTLTSLKYFSSHLCLSSTFPSPFTLTHPLHTASPPPAHTITPLSRRTSAQNLKLGKNFTVKELLSWLL